MAKPVSQLKQTPRGMVRITISLPVDLLDRLDKEWPKRGYGDRTEAIRAAIRLWVQRQEEAGVTEG